MKTEEEIRSEIRTMEFWLSTPEEQRKEDLPLIRASIATLKWVLDQTSDIFNEL
jgi:hypothetical protein